MIFMNIAAHVARCSGITLLLPAFQSIELHGVAFLPKPGGAFQEDYTKPNTNPMRCMCSPNTPNSSLRKPALADAGSTV